MNNTEHNKAAKASSSFSSEKGEKKEHKVCWNDSDSDILNGFFEMLTNIVRALSKVFRDGGKFSSVDRPETFTGNKSEGKMGSRKVEVYNILMTLKTTNDFFSPAFRSRARSKNGDDEKSSRFSGGVSGDGGESGQ